MKYNGVLMTCGGDFGFWRPSWILGRNIFGPISGYVQHTKSYICANCHAFFTKNEQSCVGHIICSTIPHIFFLTIQIKDVKRSKEHWFYFHLDFVDEKVAYVSTRQMH